MFGEERFRRSNAVGWILALCIVAAGSLKSLFDCLIGEGGEARECSWCCELHSVWLLVKDGGVTLLLGGGTVRRCYVVIH